MDKNFKIGLAVVLQVAVIAILIIVKLITLADGREILIHLLPVDPRDPLRGDYVTYRHDLSTVQSYYYGSEEVERFVDGEVVYVFLNESGGFTYPAGGMSHSRPSGDELFIKGRIIGVDDVSQEQYRNVKYRLDYGIEQYFIPEGKGEMFNRWTADRQAFAKVAIGKDGTPVLRQLYIDGKPWP